MKHIQRLRKIVTLAFHLEWIDRDPFVKFKPHLVQKERGFLTTISNQKVNSYLKEIAQMCHIEKNLTFHLARHTFATTIALTNGVPIETVSKILGHRKLSTTQIYAKVIERKVSEDMEMLQQKLSGNGQTNYEESIGAI